MPPSFGSAGPSVVSAKAQQIFENKARAMGLDPENPWIGGYVDYEWKYLPLLLHTYGVDPQDLKILEFGCNVGASAIVCSHLGAEVCAIDISEPLVDLAKANAERFGVRDIEFISVTDTRTLPFADRRFHLVICNSVLEYVDAQQLPEIQTEIDRVVVPGGHIMVLGTSSRLWPREVHSGKWLVNYVPRFLDRMMPEPLVRGIYPWAVRNGFGPHYVNIDALDKGRAFVESRLQLGASPTAVKWLGRMAGLLGVGPGLLARNISCVLRKHELRPFDRRG